MIYPDPKKSATIILSKLKPNQAESSQGIAAQPEAEIDDADAGLSSAMSDFLEAMNNKSTGDMHRALSNYIVQHTAKVNRPLVETPQDKKFTKEHEHEYSYPEK